MRVKFGAIFWWTTTLGLLYLVVTTVMTDKDRWFRKSTAAPLLPRRAGNEAFLGKQDVKNQSRDVRLHHANQTRHERRHVALLKVHKTASSTAQNVFLRFGDSRNLTFILAHTYGESKYLNVISYVNSITEDNVVAPPHDLHYDILCCHVIYNRENFARVLPADTAYIGIVREPFSRFQSAVKYFSPGYILKIRGDNSVSVYAENPLKYEPEDPRRSWTNNRMAVEFGFPADLYPGKTNERSLSKIDLYLQKLDSEFDFIIISELFEESMILMKRILGWQLKDVLYTDKNVAGSKINIRKQVPESDREKIEDFLFLDMALYQFALKRFEKVVAEQGSDFKEEVEFFKKVRKDIGPFCRSGKNGGQRMLVKSSRWSQQFEVTKQDCSEYLLHEKTFLQKQRMRMYGTLEN